MTIAAIGASLAIVLVAIRVCRRRILAFDRFVELSISGLSADRRFSTLREDIRSKPFVVGLLILVGVFAWLEISQPYFFTQDDALVAEMPGMIEGCRAVWNAEVPDYDPYRCMGGPLAATGLFSLTYPPTYLSYAIARDLLGNEFLLLEVFAAMHLLVGYLITFHLCRCLQMRPVLAFYVTLCFLLSGSTLMMGRSWHTFVTLVVWVPVLVLCVTYFERRNVGWKWALISGMSAALFFHVGFPQLWLYTMLGTGLAVIIMLISGHIPWRRALMLVPFGVVTLGGMFPLLIAQWIVTRTLHRPAILSDGLTYQWLAAIFPYPITHFAHPTGWGSIDLQYMGQMMYFGSILALLFLAGWLMFLTSRARDLSANVWLVIGGAMLLISMGGISGAPGMFATIFNHPFRALPLVVLFACLGGGIIAERMLRATVSGNARWPMFVIIFGTLLILYHVSITRPAFYNYQFTPYPLLPDSVSHRLENTKSGRMVSWSPQRSMSTQWASSLPLNLPMVYGVPSFSGYDSILEIGNAFTQAILRLSNDPLDAFRAYGIRWHLFSVALQHPVFSINKDRELKLLERTVKYFGALRAVRDQLAPSVRTADVELDEMRDVDPLAFDSSDRTTALPISMSAGHIDVDISQIKPGAGRSVVLNFLWYEPLLAIVDRNPVKIRPDEWGRVLVDLPSTGTTLQMRYAAHWMRNGAIGLLLIFTGCAMAWALGRRSVVAGQEFAA